MLYSLYSIGCDVDEVQRTRGKKRHKWSATFPITFASFFITRHQHQKQQQ
jgi:hypothetical protein